MAYSQNARPLQQWEYNVVQVDIGGVGFFTPTIESNVLGDLLNEYGADGWELVNMMDINTGQGRTETLVMTFKRLR